MKKLMVLAIAILMLSCGCQRMTESRPPTGGSRLAASVTGCLSGSDSVKVFLKVSRVIDGDTFEGNIVTARDQNAGGEWQTERMMVTVIRINGIDAPERGQFYGDVATLHLHWLISGKTVGLKLKQRAQLGLYDEQKPRQRLSPLSAKCLNEYYNNFSALLKFD